LKKKNLEKIILKKITIRKKLPFQKKNYLLQKYSPYLEIETSISHKLISAVPVATSDTTETIAFLCDDISDPQNQPDHIYYLNNQELVDLQIAFIDISKINTTAIDSSTFVISAAGVTGNVFISMPSPSVANASITLLSVNNGVEDLSEKNFWHSKDNFIHIVDFEVTLPIIFST
jgi:hypothetical protein